MLRLNGRAASRERLSTQGHRLTTTFVGVLRNNEIAAPCVFDAPMTGTCFLASLVRNFLAPAFCQGAIFAMDNLPAHNVMRACWRPLPWRGMNLA